MEGSLFYKVTVLGPSKCGKTSFLQYLTHQKCVQDQKYTQTIGVDFGVKKMNINQTDVNIQIWDISGGQKMQTFHKIYYKGTQIFVFMFDLSDIQSFQSLKMKVKSPDFNHFMECNTKNSKSPLTLLIGSKCDLQQEVTDFQIQKISKKFTLYIKISSKTGENVENAIIKIAQIKMNGTPYEWNPNFDDETQNLAVIQMNQLNIKSQQNAAPSKIQQQLIQININMLIIGPQKSGKSSIMHSFADQQFQEAYNSTIGLDLRIRSITYKKKMSYKLKIWDSAGQEKYKIDIDSYYKEANCVYVVYDCTDQNSFKQISTYLKQIQQLCIKPLYVCLVGAKFDLVKQKKVPTEIGMQFASQNQIDFMEVSSILNKENNTINTLFQRGIEWFYKNK